MERLVRSLRDEPAPRQEPPRQRSLKDLFAEIDRLPVRNPDDGFSSEDVDPALYEES